MDFLSGLNPQQQEAVQHVEGPMLLLAGAGSGKTRVITHRMAHLMSGVHVPGSCILAVTFTNKAAGEMRDRVRKLVGITTGGSPNVSTFHSFGVRLLRKDGAPLKEIRPGFTPTFTIYDADDQVSLLRGIYKGLGLDEKFLAYRAALSRISDAKSRHTSPSEFAKDAKDPISSRLAVIYERYEEALRKANALDFDDLLLETVRLLRHSGEVRSLMNRRYEFVMVDEYQDTNRTQYDLMKLLSEERSNLVVVGDEDQSIYGWRGADIRNILDFERDYPACKVIRLEQNYRSTKTILDAASNVVANNKERKGKWLWTDSGDGEKVGLYEAMDGENEALWIADTIEKRLSINPAERVAVLYRTNSQSRQIEEALRRYGRKYLVVGGFSFYQRAEVKDVVAYLKALHSPQDSIAMQRVINTPARGIGKTTTDQIEQFARDHDLNFWAAIEGVLENHSLAGRAEAAVGAFQRMMKELREELETKPVHQLLEAVVERTGYRRMLEAEQGPDAESRIQNIEELLNAAAEGAERGETVADFLDHAALVADADSVDERAQVSLLTVHNAKGLEFPVVFIAGLEEALFPHSRSLLLESAMEEERRLCYVAMTRAEKKLFVSWARYRRRFGGGPSEASLRSRFLKEIPAHLMEKIGGGASSSGDDVGLHAERAEVRESVKKNLYTGKTYNSLENIQQFFNERGMPAPRGITSQQGAGTKPAAPQFPPRAEPLRDPKSGPQKVVSIARSGGATPGQQFRSGATVVHPKWGRGTILRREGDGDDVKLTISFPGYGLKKILEKFAGIQRDE